MTGSVAGTKLKHILMELSKVKFNQYAALGKSKMRRKYGLFAVEGEKSVADTMLGFELVALIRLRGHVLRFDCDQKKIFDVSADEMRRLSSLTSYSPVMAIFRLPEISADTPLRVDRGIYMVLDGIQDPGNLGTIIRTCHWFGIFRIFASFDTVDVFNPKVIQSSMGSIAKVEVTYCNLPQLFEANPEMQVYGTLLEGDDIFSTEISPEGFIVMGNEGNGISPGIKQYITTPLFIPPARKDNHSESLNVAIASAVVVSQIVGKRYKSGIRD